MKKITLIITLSFFYFHSFAQQDSLLKNFKFRINNYRAITLGINQNTGYGKTNYLESNAENTGTSGVLNGAVTNTRSTDRLQLTINASIGAAITYSKSKDQSANTSFTNTGINGYFSVLSRWFNKNRFIEAGTALYGNSNHEKTNYTNYAQTQKNSNSNYSVTVYTGIGIGRLENITDMQNALWLNKTLQSSSSLSRTLTPDELNELGRSITKGNNTRVLDARRRTQFVLRTVDAFLQLKGLINKTDINYFTNLNDILFFAFNDNRLSGTEKFIRFTPGIESTSYISRLLPPNDKLTIKPITKSALVTIGFNTFKPLSLIHQNNYGAALKLNYTGFESTNRNYIGGVIQSESKRKLTLKQAGADLYFTHAIYPNTRTIIRFTAETEMGWFDDQVSNENFYEKSSLSANLDYFISYRTRLAIGAGFMHNKNNYQHTFQAFEMVPNRLGITFNAGVTVNL